MPKILERLLGAFHYLLGGFMILSGVATIFTAPVEGTRLGFIYSNQVSLTILGLWIAASGLIILIGKFKKHHDLISVGLFWSALVFVFAALTNIIAFGLAWPTWGGNLIASITVGSLWIYHKSQHPFLR